MKFFREEAEYRRDRNRRRWMGGWKGLLIKTALLFFVIWMIKSCQSDSVKNFFWLFGVRDVTAYKN